jgi:hypothetical protein
MLFHAAVNTSYALLPRDARGGLVSARGAVLIAAWLAVIVLVAAFGPKRLTRCQNRSRQGEILHHQS